MRAVDDGLGDHDGATQGVPKRLGLLEACGDPRRALENGACLVGLLGG